MTAVAQGHTTRRQHPMAAARTFRPKRNTPAIIAAAALLVAGVLVAAEVISALLGRPMRVLPYESVSKWAARTPWQDPWALLASSVVTALGLLLLFIALVPGRPRLMALRTGDPDLIAGISRRTLTGILARAASRVDGVSTARARLRGRRVTITVTTAVRDLSGLGERVYDAVNAELGALSPIHVIVPRVRVRGPA